MNIPKRICVIAILTILLVSSIFAIMSTNRSNAFAQVSTSTTSNNNLDQYEWSQFQGDSSFTRFSAGPAPSTSSILWKSNVTGIQPYLVAFNGMIYVCTNTSVVALDQTGKEVWATPIFINGTWPIAYKIDNSHMIVESNCLDPQTGKLLWTSSNFLPDTGIFTANVYSSEQKMFYVKLNSYIQAWDFSDPSRPPTLAWQTYIPGGGKTGIGTTYGDGLVFAGSFENQQIALNAKTGAIVWDTPTKGPMIFNGAYSDDRFIRGGTDDNTLYCFNATNGEILWTYTPPSDNDGYFVTGPAIAYGMVYEMNKDGYLYCLDIQTGNLIWRTKGPDDTLLWPGMPAVADGKVYVTIGEIAEYGGQVGVSQFACLNANTGKPIWTLPMEALAPRESIAIAYGNLYIIPGDVTTSVDATTGNEYSRLNQVWCIGTGSVPTSDWPMWRADPTHSSTAQEGPSSLTMNWKFTTNGSVISSPSVANGIVYFGSQDKKIYAVGAWSGSLIWSFTTQDAVESSLAVANGKVYTGGDDGNVYCLDANTGALIWSTFVNGDLPFTYNTIVLKSSPAVVDGIVYVGSLDNYMYALNAENGNVVWKTKTNGPIESSPAVADGTVFFVSQEPNAGALYKLDAKSGEVLWNLSLPYVYMFQGGTEMLGSPSVAAGLVFTSTNLGTYYGVNETTGKTIWTFTDPDASEFIISSPIYVNGQLFIIDKFNLACLNANNGHTIWSFFTGDELTVSPSYANGKAYMVTSQRHIFILDTTNNGTKIANFTTPSSSWSSPTIANGRLYVGCNDWNLYSFSNSVTNENPPTPSNSPNPSYNFKFQSVQLVLILVVVVLLAVVVAIGFVLRRQKRK
ncbi:MAG: PQQ-binding-like beta-propeller repeat protein [Candidatus Bathyarchaeia archaeon]